MIDAEDEQQSQPQHPAITERGAVGSLLGGAIGVLLFFQIANTTVDDANKAGVEQAVSLLEQAAAALDAAREWRQDRIEVTTASPDD